MGTQVPRSHSPGKQPSTSHPTLQACPHTHMRTHTHSPTGLPLEWTDKNPEGVDWCRMRRRPGKSLFTHHSHLAPPHTCLAEVHCFPRRHIWCSVPSPLVQQPRVGQLGAGILAEVEGLPGVHWQLPQDDFEVLFKGPEMRHVRVKSAASQAAHRLCC